MTPDHKVLIVGGGFGGLYAAREFRHAPLRVTLVDRRNFHLFQPLLYQVATGSLSPGDIASPLRRVLRKQRNTKVIMGEVVEFDSRGRKVILQDGELAYDSLIVSAGASHSYFGHDEWEQFAPGLKTIEDATEIRRRILLAFEAAERESDPEERRAWLTFVIVGGGPTGVELAGALGEIANDTMREDFRSFSPGDARILILDAAPRVLPPYPPELSSKAEKYLIQLGVRTRTGMKVTSIDSRGVTAELNGNREFIASKTVLWAAGVRASPLGRKLAESTGAETDRVGRVMVGPDLSVPGHPEIFVIGDLANVRDAKGQVVPGVAPAAMQAGRYVARLIVSRVEGKPSPGPFVYRNKGNLATVGRARAVVDFGRLRFGGFFAWVFWLFVHLMYLVGFQNRLVVFIQWAFEYFTFNRGARLITGEYCELPAVRERPGERISGT